MTKLSSKASGCVEAAIGLGPEDTSRIMELHQLYADAGLSSDQAIRKAANDLVAELQEEATDITKAIRELMGEPQFSNVGARVHEFEMSTRVPSAVKRTEDPMKDLLVADFASAQADLKWIEATAELVQSYPNYKKSRAKTTAGQLEHLIVHMVDNLLWLHDQVPAATRQRSKLWYDGARAIVDRWTRRYGITDAQAAGVLAVLSPQKDWFMNVSLARRVADIVTERESFIWSPQMEETAARIFGKDAYQEDVDAIRGKALGDLDDAYLMGMWTRVYDQAHESPAFDIISPEGDAVARAMTKTGAEGRVAWGGVSTIAKAISIIRDGSMESISQALGQQHKVRNFYNNILVPGSINGHVTIDTHAVAAALLRALSGASREVMHNFGGGIKGEVGAKSSKLSGLQGTYALYEEAYRRAAEARGILPREMQSITWEAIRGMYLPRFKSNQKNVDAVDAVWSLYQKGKISHAEARNQVLQLAGGIQPPSWSGPNPGAYDADESADDAGDLSADGVSGADPGEAVGGADRGAAGSVPGRGGQPQFSNAPDRGGRDEGRSLAPLEGAPAIDGATGPDPRLVDVAERYARQAGINLKRQAEYVKVDPERAARIAAAYDAMPHAPNDPKVKEAFDNLIRQTRAQYDALAAAGYEFTFFDDGTDPYGGNPWNAMRDLRANKKMAVYGTYAGYGTEGITAGASADNPMLAETDLQWPDQDGVMHQVTANDLFRAVHDAFGHGLEGAGFRAQGEENAWQAHIRLFTGSAVAAITSETRGQNSWLNYGPYGERNRTAGLADTVFAPQKTGLMPEWAWTEGRAGDMAEPKFSNAPRFVSQLAQMVSQSKMDSMPAAQWQVWIKSNSAKYGVKADEIEWSGIKDYLDMQGRSKLSKADVERFLADGGVKVEETVLVGDAKFNGTGWDSERGSWVVYDTSGDVVADNFATEQDAVEWMDENGADYVPAKYAGYRVPGGENYREVLVTLPETIKTRALSLDEVNAARAKVSRLLAPLTAAEYESMVADGTVPTAELDRPSPYKSKHWDQPNVLVHFRADDRTDADGNRVLFLHDLQSDWGQDIKKAGVYRETDPADLRRLAQVAREKDEDRDNAESLYRAARGDVKYWDEKLKKMRQDPRVRADHVEDAEASLSAALERKAKTEAEFESASRALVEAESALNAAMKPSGIVSGPFVTDTKAWVALGLKRAIMMAVEAGQDRVAVVNGEQAADMFDLSKQVNSITAYKLGDGKYRISAIDSSGKQLPAQNASSDAELEDMIGKEMAAKVAGQPGQVETYTGLDLKMGGEGMKVFYDQIVPQVMRDVAKKLGGRFGASKVGDDHGLNIEETWDGKWAVRRGNAVLARLEKREAAQARLDDLKALANAKLTEQASILITPAMREKVMAGVPLFSNAPTRDATLDDFKPENLQGLLQTDRWAVLTAEDPGAQKASAAQNRAAMQRLKIDLREAGAEFTPVVGKYGDVQGSLIVTGIDEDKAIELGKKYGQESILTRRGLVYMDGRPDTKAVGVQVFDRPPEDFYTEVPSTGAFFSVDLDWGDAQFSNTAGRLDGLDGYHFSKAQRTVLTGGAYGTNFAGSGKEEYLSASDKRRRQRVYFYVDKGTGINPESGVGGYAHRAVLNNVYDADSDPLNLTRGSQAATETAILDAGFDGYLSRLGGTQSGQVIMLGPKSIKVDPLPAGERPRSGKVVPAATKKAEMAKRSGNELVRKPAADDMMAFIDARKAVEAAAPSFRMEYGEARVKIDEAAAADAAFEAAGAKFRFGEAPQFSNTAQFAGQDLPAETRTQKTRRVAQDYFLRTKIVQDFVIGQGGTVGEAQDVYRAEERSYGRVQAQLEDFAKRWVAPMLEKAAKAGVEMDELALYAYAKHAPERNAYIDTINPAMNGAGSGMSDADAAKIVADVQASGKAQAFEDLRQDLLAITETTRQVLLQDGLITQDEYDAWTNAYQDYVPLRGLENVDDEGRPKPGVGRGVNIRGKESVAALGRRSRAGDVIENIVRDYERAVIRGERNNVAKTFLDLVTTNPDPDLWEVNAQKSDRKIDPMTGMVKAFTTTDSGDDTVGVKVGGRQVYIKVKDPLLLRAMRQAAKDETGEFQSMLAKSLGVYNNWLRNTLTRYNPVFGAVNAVRDLQAGAVATLDKLGAQGLKLYSKHYRAALAASVRNEFDALGKTGSMFGDPVMDKWFDEYRRAGGTTAGWFLRDVEDIHTDIRQMMVAAGSAPRNTGERITGSVAWQAGKSLLKYVELFGSASENAGRVAAYRAAREMGRSPAEAASIAKNLTTNFNRKGEWGTALSSAYLFFNAAVQGTARVLEALKNRRVQALMGGVSAMAATLAVMGAEMGGDDDDGQAYWDKIPDYEKERNLIIMLPPGIQHDGVEKVGEMGRYIKVPMPYGFNVFAVLGYTMADAGRYAVDPMRGKSPAKLAINLVSAVAGSYNPMGGAFDVTDPVAVGMAVAPTIVDAGIQLGAGVNSFGTPVGPKGSPFDTRPDSERFTVSQGGGASQRIARWVNENTGGNRARSGAIDVMPGTIDNVVSMAGGGTGKFLFDVFVNMPTKLSNDESVFRYRDLPFLRNFAGQVDENVDRGLFYTRMDEVLKEARAAKNEMKMGISVKYDPRSRAMQSIGKMADDYSGLMTDLRKEDLAIVNDPSLTAEERKSQRKDVERRRNEFVREFNRAFLETERDLARGSFDKE